MVGYSPDTRGRNIFTTFTDYERVAAERGDRGFWSLNGARVVSLADDKARFAFAYGTLTNHAEHGEELFEVSLDAQSGDVTYRIRAVSWPQAMLARVGYPIVRSLQARFRRDSAAAMRRAVRQA